VGLGTFWVELHCKDFDVKMGLHQGCVLSSLMFLVVLEVTVHCSHYRFDWGAILCKM